MDSVVTRPAAVADLPRMDAIRAAAFTPVFASFRALLGDDIYELAQKREDDAQGELLLSLMEAGSGWDVFVAEIDGALVGFVSVQLDKDSSLGEIGLNAVDPDHAGRGIGTEMYHFALEHMRQAGMRVATVSTGADSSHAAARRAYEKAGFRAQVPSVWMCRKL